MFQSQSSETTIGSILYKLWADRSIVSTLLLTLVLLYTTTRGRYIKPKYTNVICIDDLDDFERHNWSTILTDFKYAETSADLPPNLGLGGLEGRGIFYFEGGSNSVQWFIERGLQLLEDAEEEGEERSQLYMHVTYFALADRDKTRVYVYPTLYEEEGVSEYFRQLPATNDATKWGHKTVELDRRIVRRRWEWIGLETIGFQKGEYFLIDQIILTEGYPQAELEKLCPSKQVSMTTQHSGTMVTTPITTSSTTPKDDLSSESNEPKDYIWTLVAILLILGACAIIVVFLWYSVRGLKDLRRNLSDAEVKQFLRGGGSRQNSTTSAGPDGGIHGPIYELAYDENLEIQRDKIELDTSLGPLGSGQFGVVWKGFWQLGNGKRVTVAVKTVDSEVDVNTFKALLSEIKIMSFLGCHDNIARLVGACTASIKKRKVFALVEFCANGDLRHFLRRQAELLKELTPTTTTAPVAAGGGANNLPQNVSYVQWTPPATISLPCLLKFCLGVANGMKFLTEKNVIHGDLAARNILVTEQLEIKISDFGLSRQLLNYAVYQKKQKKVALPWKHMSIEAIKSMKFSIKSDVWSFGVVLWEIFSMGDDPYPTTTFGGTFLQELLSGKRLERPQLANQFVHDMMLECWEEEPVARPTFETLHGQLGQLLVNSGLRGPLWTNNGDAENLPNLQSNSNAPPTDYVQFVRN